MSVNEPTRRLLAEAFPDDPKFSRDAFLDWEYDSPSGRVIERNRDDEAGRLGHYAVLPQRWQRDGVVEPWALSLNTAVSERARGQGLFTTLADETYELARTERGVRTIVGVANANSTPGFVGRLRFSLVGPLDVAVLPWRPSIAARAIDRITVEQLLADPLVQNPVYRPGAFTRVWDAAELAWRLASPGASYSVFRAPGALAITCASSFAKVPVAVLLKVIVAGDDVVDLGPIVAAACTHHRAPAALHAGSNPDLRFRGMPLPDRFRPSPLNLIVRSLDPDRPSESVIPSTFEFLEFDAY
jgi:GNAT superfamily N-acetyltransferase